MATQTNYDLLKYSRSYPSDDPARFSTQPTSYDTEWQHFSNPKLQLFLDDVSPDADGQSFRSAKVKILWVPMGSALQRVQQETTVCLEDMDLRSLSHVSTAPKKAQPQIPPLKVVYRDSVVGFRYLYSLVITAGTLPAYRRFQICFKDPLLATQFVDSIRRFCPCKASLPSTGAPVQTTAVMSRIPAAPANDMYTESFTAGSHQHSARALNRDANLLMNDPQNQPHTMQPPTLFTTKDQVNQSNAKTSRLPLSRTTTYPLHATATPHISSSLQVSQNTDTPSLPSTSITACFPPKPDNATQPTYHTHMACSTSGVSAGINDPLTGSKHSTQGSITSSVHRRTETALTINMTHSNDPKDKDHNHNLNEISIEPPQALVPPHCLKDFSAIKELCALSIDQLEHLVGEVIREPEFFPLLEKLDAMWKVKGFMTTKDYKH